MYTFCIRLSHDEELEFKHVTEIKYYNEHEYVINGDGMLKHSFPLESELQLYSENCSTILNVSHPMYIQITNES